MLDLIHFCSLIHDLIYGILIEIIHDLDCYVSIIYLIEGKLDFSITTGA